MYHLNWMCHVCPDDCYKMGGDIGDCQCGKVIIPRVENLFALMIVFGRGVGVCKMFSVVGENVEVGAES